MQVDKQRAEVIYPGNEALQTKWLAAVAWLRSRGKWVLEGGKVSWGHGTDTTRKV